MNLTKYFSPVFQKEDETGSVIDVAPEVVVSPENTEMVVAPTEEAEKQPIIPKWAIDKISEKEQKLRENNDRLSAAERRASEAEALAERLQRGDSTQTNTGPILNQEEFKKEVQREAAAQRFHEDTVKVKSSGFTQFGANFQETLQILNAVGATSDDFVLDVLAVDKNNAHVLLDKLAKDPERTAALAGMDSRSRIAELTRLTMAVPAEKTEIKQEVKPTKQVSKAPNPPPVVEPSSSKTIDGYSDEATDEQFTAQFNERMRARTQRH